MVARLSSSCMGCLALSRTTKPLASTFDFLLATGQVSYLTPGYRELAHDLEADVYAVVCFSLPALPISNSRRTCATMVTHHTIQRTWPASGLPALRSSLSSYLHQHPQPSCSRTCDRPAAEHDGCRHNYISMAEDLEEFMDQHRIQTATLIGHSMSVPNLEQPNP